MRPCESPPLRSPLNPAAPLKPMRAASTPGPKACWVPHLAALCLLPLGTLSASPLGQEEEPETPVVTEHSSTQESVAGQHEQGDPNSPNRITDVYIPLKTLPERPAALLEIGQRFMHPGDIGAAFTLPTGATWAPNFLVYGTLRSSVDYREDSLSWANRLDLFGNLQLSGTERILIGLRPLDEDGRFSGYEWDPEVGEVNELNTRIETLFFEGDFGEIFPHLDPEDKGSLDIGFSVGRQPIFFQNGILINDTLDALTLTRNNVRWSGISNFRATAMFAWDEVHRGNNQFDSSAKVLGLFTQTDTPVSTIEVDLAAVSADEAGAGDSLHGGLSFIQRFGHYNTAFRVNSSQNLDDESGFATDGTLITSEISTTPVGTHDLVYLNSFVGLDEFTSVARNPSAGGPLGLMGILFAATGLGQGGAPVSNRSADALGGAFGYQKIMDGGRRQLIAELGTRFDTDGADTNTVMAGARYQQALGRQWIFIFDVFGGWDEQDDGVAGIRTEFLMKF